MSQSNFSREIMETQVIHIHKNAPEKPQWGEPCNGCGVCCLAEPCPLSQVMFLRRSGSCPAIVWQPYINRYECGMVISPSLHHRLIPLWADRFLTHLFSRWISTDSGCDSSANIGE